MNLTRLLWNRLITEAIANSEYGLSIIDIVETKLKLKIPAEKKVSLDADPETIQAKGSVPYQRLKRARFVYSEWTLLLKNHSELARALTKSKADLKKEEVSNGRIIKQVIISDY